MGDNPCRVRPLGLIYSLVKPRHITYALLIAAALAWIVGVMYLTNGHW